MSETLIVSELPETSDNNWERYMDGVRLVTCIRMFLFCNQRAESVTNRFNLKPYFLCKNKNIYCSICMEDISSKEYVRELDCSHQFHKKCIDKWIKKNEALDCKICCPMCRKEIS